MASVFDARPSTAPTIGEGCGVGELQVAHSDGHCVAAAITAELVALAHRPPWRNGSLVPNGAKSQATVDARIRVLPPDSVPWRPIIQYVVASLAGDIARAAHDTTPHAWHISLPDSSTAWMQLRTHLYTVLRARAPREAEVNADELTIGPMRM